MLTSEAEDLAGWFRPKRVCRWYRHLQSTRNEISMMKKGVSRAGELDRSGALSWGEEACGHVRSHGSQSRAFLSGILSGARV